MASLYYFLVFIVLNTYFVIILCVGEMGMGKWSVKHVTECEDPDKYKLKAEVTRRILNRTHDAYDVSFCLEKPLDETYGLHVDIYKLCEGGWKFQQSIIDSYACKFANDSSRSNLEKAAELADIAPDCPLPEGCHVIQNFIVNNDDLPKQGTYGETEIQAYITHAEEKISCLKIELEFE